MDKGLHFWKIVVALSLTITSGYKNSYNTLIIALSISYYMDTFYFI